MTQDNKVVMSGVYVSKVYKLCITLLLPSSVAAFHAGSIDVPSKKESQQSLNVWHKRLAHVHYDMLKKMSSHNTVEDLHILGRPGPLLFCTGCAYGKKSLIQCLLDFLVLQ